VCQSLDRGLAGPTVMGVKIRPNPRDDFHPTRLYTPPRSQVFRAAACAEIGVGLVRGGGALGASPFLV